MHFKILKCFSFFSGIGGKEERLAVSNFSRLPLFAENIQILIFLFHIKKQ
jgi:hypothetical protein